MGRERGTMRRGSRGYGVWKRVAGFWYEGVWRGIGERGSIIEVEREKEERSVM